VQIPSYDDSSEEDEEDDGPDVEQEDPNVGEEAQAPQNDAPSAEPTPSRRKRGRTPQKAPENDVPRTESTPEPTPPAKKKRGRPPQKKKATMTPPESADEYDEVADPTPETPPPAKKKRGRSKKATPPPDNAVTEPTPKKKQEGSLWGPRSSEEQYAAIKAAIADFFALKDDTEIWYTGNKELWAHVSKHVGKPVNTLTCQFERRMEKGGKTEELLQDLQEAIDDKRSSGGVARSAKHPGDPAPQRQRATRQKRSSALKTTNPTPQKQDEGSVKLKKFREALIEQYRGDDDRSREFAEMCKQACAASSVDFVALFQSTKTRAEDGLRKRTYANLDYSEKELVRVVVERAVTRELASRFDKTIPTDDDVKEKLAGVLDLIDETDIDTIEKEYCVSRNRRVLFLLDGSEKYMVPCITLPRKYIHLNAKQASRQGAPKKMDHDAFVKFVYDPEADYDPDAPPSEWRVDLNGDVGDMTKSGMSKVFIPERTGEWRKMWPKNSDDVRQVTERAPFYESFERHWKQEE
jgi:hypothetical protein